MKFKKMMALVFSASLIISSIGVSAETNPAGDQNSDNTNIASADMPFEDVSESNQEIYASVAYVWRNDLMDGVSDREFKPDDYLTRAMYVTVLGRTAEIDTSEYEGTNYSDVKDGQWYTPYIEWAHENEITYGIGDHLFGVNEIVTREQIATFIARYLVAEDKKLNNETDPLDEMYEDASNIHDWAADSVALMNKYAIMQGDDDGNFRPQAGVTRAEAAIIFERLDKLLNKVGTSVLDIKHNYGAAVYHYSKEDAEKLTNEPRDINGKLYNNNPYLKFWGDEDGIKEQTFFFDDKSYTHFTGTAFMTYAAVSFGGQAKNPNAIFSVYLDNNTAPAYQKELSADGTPESFDIDINGAKKLTVKVEFRGNISNIYDLAYVYLCNPLLLK